MDNIFQSGIAPNLIPNAPGDVPDAFSAGNATASQSPFSEPQDVDSIIKNLVLDRPLKLYVPEREKYPDWEFHIINSVPAEIADAHNKGFKEVTEEKFTALFNDLVAGTDKNGKAFRPMLMARPKAVGEVVRKRHRQQLKSLYAGMDPKNRVFNEKYSENAVSESRANFEGGGFRIRG